MVFAIVKITNPDNRDYLDTLYRTHYAVLSKLAQSIVHDETIAGDIVTNAMLSLFSLVPLLRNLDAAERTAYLKATTRNAAYKYYNTHKKRTLTEIDCGEDYLCSLPDLGSADPCKAILADEELQQVRNAVASLNERDRVLLHLKYAAELNANEIAELTDAPSAAAVNERLTRARRKVLKLLQQQGWTNE